MNFPKNTFSEGIEAIKDKVLAGIRISTNEAITLYNNAPLMLLGELALSVKRQKSQDKIFYNNNFHIEPTNICIYNCKFCSFRQPRESSEAWNMGIKQVVDYAIANFTDNMTEVHLVGGVHPDATIEYYGEMIKSLRALMPNISIKAFSAIEHIYVYEKEGISYHDGLKYLKECGMDSITGGGAEIFNSAVRSQICAEKADADKWLNLHHAAHDLGIKSAATMLYGHLESLEDRIDHISKIRDLQDLTGGFTAFIPLKFRSKNNSMEYLGESTLITDLKTIAISRILLDNVPHIKAYPPSIGIDNTPFALMFGADDIDGTVNDTTKIYSMAGVNNRLLTESDLRSIALNAGFRAVERDTFYNEI